MDWGSVFSTLPSLKNTSNNVIVLTVENSRTQLVDFCRSSGKFRTMSSATEKVHLPSVH